MQDVYSAGNPEATAEFVAEVFEMYLPERAAYARRFQTSDRDGEYYRHGYVGLFSAEGQQIGSEISLLRMRWLAGEFKYTTYLVH